jgi:hypothetical protein
MMHGLANPKLKSMFVCVSVLFRCVSNLSGLSVTEQLGNTLDLYPEHAWFESWLETLFYGRLWSSSVLPGHHRCNTVRDRCLPDLIPFIICQPSHSLDAVQFEIVGTP